MNAPSGPRQDAGSLILSSAETGPASLDRRPGQFTFRSTQPVAARQLDGRPRLLRSALQCPTRPHTQPHDPYGGRSGRPGQGIPTPPAGRARLSENVSALDFLWPCR
jgi:hypothetical protein